MDDSQKPARDALLPGSIIVAALLIAGALVYNVGYKNQNQQANVANSVVSGDLVDDDVVLGSPSASVTVVEFGDYQCPFCARFFSTTELQLRQDYIKTGRAKMVYRDFAFLGPESTGAALASQCAAEQGKFWAYHDVLFEAESIDGKENNGNLSDDFLKSIASELGLNRAQFSDCLSSEKYANEVKKDYDDGLAVGVNGTPTTFVNGKSVSGAASYDTIKAMIDEALKTAR